MREAVQPTGGGQDATAVYALGSSHGESARLQRQAEELAPDSAALLDRVGLQLGQSAIDLGCGPRGILDLLAGRVSPGGRVVGLDADPAHTAMAAEFAAGRGLSDVEIVRGDARHTGLPAGSFDLVHARTLLTNVPEPAEVVAEMARLARPGGWVASMEPDTEYAMCYPPHPAFSRICEIFPVAFGRNGADPLIGRRVPDLFRAAGLVDVGVEARVQIYPRGHSRRTIRLDLVRSMRPQVAELGLASEAELDELDSAARAHLDDPRTIVISGHIFLARRPASQLEPPSSEGSNSPHFASFVLLGDERGVAALLDSETEAGAAHFMINCAHPTHFADVLDDGGVWVDKVRGLRANASAKRHAELDESAEVDEGDPGELAPSCRDLASRMPNLTILGGCCGTDYRHVGAICAALAR